jgi:hypothetical protein
MRAIPPAQSPGEDHAFVGQREFRKGDRLRLRLGARRSDATDSLLDGRVAILETIYRDPDERVYLAVILEDDPAADMQRDLGRYLFFFPDEVRNLTRPTEPAIQ